MLEMANVVDVDFGGWTSNPEKARRSRQFCFGDVLQQGLGFVAAMLQVGCHKFLAVVFVRMLLLPLIVSGKRFGVLAVEILILDRFGIRP